MEWNRSDLLMLARRGCTLCNGSGLSREPSDTPLPCGCVLRAIFRSCHDRFRRCAEKGKFCGPVHLERNPSGRSYRGTWGRKEEEYIADFELVSRRTLSEEQFQLFRFHYVLGADWKLCCRRVGLNRGRFFHEIYRIEETLGRVFYELEPYALYPTRDYFTVRTTRPLKPMGGAVSAAGEKPSGLRKISA